MTSPYNPAAAALVPVPLPIAIDGDDNARPNLGTSSKQSNYSLPISSRHIGPIHEDIISQLLQQGFTRGLASSLSQTIKSYPLRIWVVDNSGSMQKTDGHRFVETSRKNDIKVVSCSRWNEIRECVDYHIQMAATLGAPTAFRMLNDPAVGTDSQQFGIAENSLDPHVIEGEVSRAREIMKTAQPGGVTPLVRHLNEIRQSVTEMAPDLRADGCRVAVILATDGLPTDDQGYGGTNIQGQFLEAMRSLEKLPIWMVIRLCTDEEAVVKFYNELDTQLELSIEVLDDFLEEALEVYGHNPWLNYALPLHRLREMGYYNRLLDMIDERMLTHEELREFCCLLFGDDSLPDPSADWKEFSISIGNHLKKEKAQWNPVTKRVSPWIDLAKLCRIYDGGCSCTIM